MKRYIAILSFLIASSISGPSHAMLSGNELHEICTSGMDAACDYYIMGSAEGLSLMNLIASDVSKSIKQTICMPNGVTNRRLIDIVKNYVRDNPKKRGQPASGIVFFALTDTFPCKN